MGSLKITMYALVTLVAALVAFSMFSGVSASKKQTNSSPVTVRWLLAHQPTNVFDRATKVFSDTLAKEGDGITLQIVTPRELGYTNGDVPHSEVLNQLSAGKAEMASAYTVALGQNNPSLWALTLPYLFSSYDGLPAILDGQVGQQLLSTLESANSGIRGLAFTLSGGFRIIVSKNTAVQSLADLKGLHIATSGGPVAEATLKALGAIPASANLENGTQSFDAATIDGVETTYGRLAEVLGGETEYTKYINETNHSMFLTAIIVNKDFYDSLSAKNQAAMRVAAMAAATVERNDSIALGDSVKSQLLAKGSVVSTLSSEARDIFAKATAAVYAQFSPTIGADIVRDLVNEQR
ncbi:TRAP transporter substrate-binding protein [Candidatus Kaiserbacteria bacterium]|nr:TRAP transporter substrate-binding protein [Candidatus Kaiserbacteria bacterium]